jgi:hypothetical protein
MAEALCRLGATQHQLADSFGVAIRTIEQWLVNHPEFHDAVHKGLYEGFSPRVVRSLAQQAIGYDIEIEEQKLLANGQVMKLTQRKHILTNVAATIFWLMLPHNARPNDGRW